MKTSRRQINWDDAKQRLARAQSEFSDGLHADSGQLTKVFRQRAERLARRGTCELVQAKLTAVLTFRSANERFGLDLANVVQVYPRVLITPVPGAAPELMGVANLQGNVRSIIDLGRLMDLSSSVSERGYIVMMRVGEALVGLYVESVDDIHHLELDKLSPIEPTSSEHLRRLVKGITDDCIIVLNPEGLVSSVRHARSPTIAGNV